MDTRRKILDRRSLPSRHSSLRIAKGWFDVLTAEQCDHLSELKRSGGTLGVLVYGDDTARPAPLCAFDRAQMVAAVGSVDWVCICEALESDGIARSLQAKTVLDIESVQQRDVVRDVLERHQQG